MKYSTRPIDTKTKREAVTVPYMSVPMHKLSSIDAAYGLWHGTADSTNNAVSVWRYGAVSGQDKMVE